MNKDHEMDYDSSTAENVDSPPTDNHGHQTLNTSKGSKGAQNNLHIYALQHER